MPLYRIPGPEAVSIRKSNPNAGWGNRAELNRVEPFAKPSFDVPAPLEPGENIFTVGSCFAREVEKELLRLGFTLPMRELFKTPEFSGLPVSAINNFGTPSIYNEFAWALDEKPFNPDDHLFEIGDNKFIDLHLVPSARPESREALIKRRVAIRTAYRTVLSCRVVVMTLGLAEVWYDTQSGFYLNTTPRPAALRSEPDRFELHVLSFDEAYGFLRNAMSLLKSRCRPDLRVILTVSPVPLMATHRPADVIVANAYSKSVLRTAAETACAEFDFITYYPSYEGVTLSDRKLAWMDDLVHVTDDIVAVQVSRMIAGYTGADINAPQAPIEAALEHAASLEVRGDFAAIPRLLEPFKHEPAAATVIAYAYIRAGAPEDAVSLLSPFIKPGLKAARVWEALITAYIATGRIEDAARTADAWLGAMPGLAVKSARTVARLFNDTDSAKARNYLKIAEEKRIARAG